MKVFNRNLCQTIADNSAKAVVAAVLLILHRRKWHKENIIKFYQDIIGVLEQPPIFGKYMQDYDMQRFLTEKYGIDFERVKLRIKI